MSAPTTVATTPQPAPTAAAEVVPGAAPDEPLAFDNWTPGTKLGVGTAYTYDQPPGEANPSRVWFGITNGAITEGLYPDVSQANVKALSLLVTDGKSFVADELEDATYTIERLDGRTPAYRVISTDKEQRWAVVKEIVADPRADTILFTVTFQALEGLPADYRLYLLYTPRLGNSGDGDLSKVQDGVAEAWDEQAGIYTTLAANPAPALLTTGYTGINDLTIDLKDYKVDVDYHATGIPGRLTIGVELSTTSASTVALGFGDSQIDARKAADTSLQRGFATIANEYMQDWAGYLDKLVHPLPDLPLYDESAAIIKTHEDKTFYGAGVASLSTPWGQQRDDRNARERGYRYVWPRDLYHVGMALLVMGDQQGARNTLAYLDDVLQKSDGSFPQNAFLDGTPNWGNLQMDEVADPIILAWHLKASDRYASLVKPAANVILAIGPRTSQERWEENGGFSPATLAAEIAGLVCAADLARQAGETADAERYLQTADEWNNNLEKWTFTTNGSLGEGAYYLRITNGDPNAHFPLQIRNGGGIYDQREIVDQSFLEIVRLGLRKPDDPNIMATLAVIDTTIKVDTPQGPIYRRYPYDGYGEHPDGRPYNGSGVGRAWPLLTGERAHYELAAGNTAEARRLMGTLAASANEGGMLPEQVWDAPDIPGQGLFFGRPTGSATPLAWAHAEYILLANTIRQGAISDMPTVVAQRYLK
jgi:glucoamylase